MDYNCSGSKKTEIVMSLFRMIFPSKCGMARNQHIIKPLANISTLTTQSRRVSLRPSVLDSLASFPWGYILASLANRGGSLHIIMKPRSWSLALPKSHWSLPRIDATEYWKQDRALISSLPLHHEIVAESDQPLIEHTSKGICFP